MAQYIVNFDIENSRIYDIMLEGTDWKKLDSESLRMVRETWAKFRTAICKYIGQEETRFIKEENLEAAMSILQQINTMSGADDDLILVPLTHKYLSNYLIYEVQEEPLDRVCVDGKIIQSFFAYTPQDDLQIMKKIISLWENGSDVMFCAHNLDYEYRYITTNCKDFLKMLLEKSIDHVILADKTSAIKSLEFIRGDQTLKNGKLTIENPNKFIIRDTWLMAGQRSIKDLGASFGLPKLEYEYTATRICKDDLTEHDYEYNQRDNEVALMFLLDLMKQNSDYINITKMPVSATQHYKNECRKDPTINSEKISIRKKKDGTTREVKTQLAFEHKKLSVNYNMPTAYLHTCFFNASGGGVVGVNPELTNQWHSNCHSFDISSAHPSQIFSRRFPRGDKTKKLSIDECKKLSKMVRVGAAIMTSDPKGYYNYFNPDKDYLVHCKLVGVKEKHFQNGNIVNVLGTGNVTLDNSDFITDGLTATRQAQTKSCIRRELDTEHKYFKYGKIRQCVSYTKWFYYIDLIYILSFYDVEAVIIDEAYSYPMVNVDQYTLNCFLKYATLKDEYKMFVKVGKEKGYYELLETVEQSVHEGIAQPYTLEALKAHEIDYNDFMAMELLRIKATFNGQFGLCYIQFVHHELEFDPENDYAISTTGVVPDYKECVSKTSTHYCVGAYIAAWSRFELACMLHHAINEGATCLYWATDSIKLYGADECLFDGWYGKIKSYSTFGHLNKWDFGKVDCETSGHACDMYIIESLKYLAVTYNADKSILDKIGKRIAIKYTISGFRAGVYLADLLDEWTVKTKGTEIISTGKEYNEENVNAIKQILAEKFSPHIIPADQTGKLAPDYSNKGYPTPLNQINFAPLVSMPYNLGGFKI